MSFLGAATLTVFPLMMAYAAFSDLFTMTISNRISILLILCFPVAGFAAGLPASAMAWHAGASVAVLALTFVFFARGWIGGGDAKLAAATALWLGWENLPEYGLEASLIGAVLTIGILLARKQALPAKLMGYPWVARLHRAGTGVPYGIALAIAGLSLYPQTTVWRAVLSA